MDDFTLRRQMEAQVKAKETRLGGGKLKLETGNTPTPTHIHTHTHTDAQGPFGWGEHGEEDKGRKGKGREKRRATFREEGRIRMKENKTCGRGWGARGEDERHA